MLDGLLSEPRRTFVELLEFDGEDLRGRPLTARREVLAWLLRGAPAGIALNAHNEAEARSSTTGTPPRSVCEGIVSKRLDLPYRSGRSDCWIKVKNPNAPAVTREAEERVCTMSRQFVSSGSGSIVGTPMSVIVSNGSSHSVGSGGTDIDDVVLSGGTVFVELGGFASSTTISAGGFLHIERGGSDSGAVLLGKEFVSKGGTASRTTITSQGLEVVSAGGMVVAAVVQNNGSSIIGSGSGLNVLGVATATIIDGNGQERVFSGGTDINATVYSGVLRVHSGGTAIGTTITSQGLELADNLKSRLHDVYGSR